MKIQIFGQWYFVPSGSPLTINNWGEQIEILISNQVIARLDKDAGFTIEKPSKTELEEIERNVHLLRSKRS